LIRRKSTAEFGTVPISLGLWLGSGVTPNREDSAVQDYQNLARGDAGNRFILLSCPWCGIDMGPGPYGREIRAFGYHLERDSAGKRRFVFRCEDPACEFSKESGHPLTVIDEAIYASPPTMLIGTVDKFAMLPWTPGSRKIFGIDNEACRTPPDLIIQDELHLISGPLGSMVGHYETVIDELTTRVQDNIRIPTKIVASTATIARAAEQVGSLYGRKSFLFPPQGLSAEDSFFAREGSKADGRTYVGVLASALPSHVTAQVWTLSILIQAPLLLDGPPDTAIDPYWTLMVYFNSLRELGRAATLVQADIRERLNALWDRIGISKEMIRPGDRDVRRFINNFRELTSRLRSDDVPVVLQELFTARPDNNAIDLCYATNMIQVGLDVPRLSLMTIVGQPKGTSEYIQASSRVGREAGKPGLVITNYNPFKPRDRSHFESFRGYHENVYKHVEPTSVTPFSVPVSERAIHALAVVLIRFRYPSLRNNPRGGLDGEARSYVHIVIRARIKQISPEEEVRGMAILDDFLDDWDRVRPNFYGDFVDRSDDETLLWPAGKPFPPGRIGNTISRQTASSMRNVDVECEAWPIRNYQEADT
jgi:Helicase conserved C-terminal domain